MIIRLLFLLYSMYLSLVKEVLDNHHKSRQQIRQAFHRFFHQYDSQIMVYKSANTNLIRQAKVHSYPWNKHDTQYNDSFKEQTYLIINIPWFQKVPEQIHPSSAIFIYQQVLCGYHNWIHYHGNLIHLLVQKLWTWFSWNTLTKKKLKKTEKENIYLVF